MRLRGQATAVEYRQWLSCPMCGANGAVIGRLCRPWFNFGGRHFLPPPTGSIPLRQCGACALVFKEYVPTPEALSSILRVAPARLWRRTGVLYRNEIAMIERFRPPSDNPSIIDVGSACGDLLSAASRIFARRSALDIIENPACKSKVSGVYLVQSFDNPVTELEPSYDVVTALDIVEHLYNPPVAFGNFGRLLRPGGILVIHTGDSAYLPLADLGSWRYLHLFEHTMAWSERTLVTSLEASNFRLEFLARSRHKDLAYLSPIRQVGLRTLRIVARSRAVAERMDCWLGLDPRLLADPGASDHMTAVFRKI